MDISISQNIHRVAKIKISRDEHNGSSWLDFDFIDKHGEVFNITVFPDSGDANSIPIEWVFPKLEEESE